MNNYHVYACCRSESSWLGMLIKSYHVYGCYIIKILFPFLSSKMLICRVIMFMQDKATASFNGKT